MKKLNIKFYQYTVENSWFEVKKVLFPLFCGIKVWISWRWYKDAFYLLWMPLIYILISFWLVYAAYQGYHYAWRGEFVFLCTASFCMSMTFTLYRFSIIENLWRTEVTGNSEIIALSSQCKFAKYYQWSQRKVNACQWKWYSLCTRSLILCLKIDE